MTTRSSDVILVVDDDPTTCALTTTLLAREGYRTCYSTTGAEALQIVETQNVSLILLDVVMPGMDGFEVCSRLRATEKGKQVPIILLTGRNDVDTRLEGMQSGVSEFLTKPVTRHELLARVRAQLHILNLTRQLEQIEESLKTRPDHLTPVPR
jgi:DNA-binding response OmpR family regulator